MVIFHLECDVVISNATNEFFKSQMVFSILLLFRICEVLDIALVFYFFWHFIAMYIFDTQGCKHICIFYTQGCKHVCIFTRKFVNTCVYFTHKVVNICVFFTRKVVNTCVYFTHNVVNTCVYLQARL